MVEFALAFPIVALVLFGILEYGIILFDNIELTNAVREGARAGAIHFESSPIPIPAADRQAQAQTAAQNSASHIISCPIGTPSVSVYTPPPPGTGSPATVTVTVACTYTPITPLGGLVLLFRTSINNMLNLSESATRYTEP